MHDERDIMHEASLVGMHATTYIRQLGLSAVCNDWVYYVCAASYTVRVSSKEGGAGEASPPNSSTSPPN